MVETQDQHNMTNNVITMFNTYIEREIMIWLRVTKSSLKNVIMPVGKD